VVRLLETLYGFTALAFVIAIINATRGSPSWARRFGAIGAVGVVASVLLYWYLGDPR
jgi:hypothetical protein